MLKPLLKMQFKDYKLFITVIVCFLSLSCFPQPGLQGDISISINTKKYAIEAYSISKIDSINDFSELVELEIQVHTQHKNLVVVNFVDERKDLFAENILLVISRNNKKMMIIITGELNPYENYALDINKVCYAIFTIEVKRENTKIHKNRRGKDLTPLLKKMNQ